MTKFRMRLADAFYGFRYGHTRRDIDRIRLARLRLLVRREIVRLEREAVRDDYFSFHATSCRLAAQTLARRLEGIVNGVDCEAYRVLLDHLLIERGNLNARRIFQWDYWHSLDDFNKSRIQCPVMPVVNPTSKQYGKLLKGLGESFTPDALHDERRFHIRYWHRWGSPFLRLFVRPFRSAKVISPP